MSSAPSSGCLNDDGYGPAEAVRAAAAQSAAIIRQVAAIAIALDNANQLVENYKDQRDISDRALKIAELALELGVIELGGLELGVVGRRQGRIRVGHGDRHAHVAGDRQRALTMKLDPQRIVVERQRQAGDPHPLGRRPAQPSFTSDQGAATKDRHRANSRSERGHVHASERVSQPPRCRPSHVTRAHPTFERDHERSISPDAKARLNAGSSRPARPRSRRRAHRWPD